MRFGVPSNVLSLKFHKLQKLSVTFLYMVIQEVYKRRQQVKEQLLKSIKNKKIQSEVLSIDVSKMDPWVTQNTDPKNYGKTAFEEFSSDEEDEPKDYHVVVPKNASIFYSQMYLYIRSGGGRQKGFSNVLKQIKAIKNN